MAAFIIPLAIETPLYTMRVSLGGRDFVLKLDWNERLARWFISIGLVSGEWLATGYRMIADMPIFQRVTDPRMPAGHLVLVNSGPVEGKPVEFSDLGTNAQLFFLPYE